MKKRVFLVAVLLLPVFYLAAGGASDKSNMPFNWSLGLQDKKGEFISFSKPIKSKKGDRFSLLINPDAACFCYVIMELPDENDLVVLFSGHLQKDEQWRSTELEPVTPGDSDFYVIVSQEEQKTLAKRISAFSAKSGNAQRRALMNEVFSIRSAVSQFKETPEKPILTGGAVRNVDNREEFSGFDTYVKTITIEY